MPPLVILLIGLTLGSCSMDMEGYLLDEHPDLFNDWNSQMPVLPESHMGELEDVRFLLWTRTNAADDMYYSLLPGNLENLSQSPFNASLPTLVIFHGFTGSGEQEWVRDTKTEFLKILDNNVISVDYPTMVVSPWYNYAVENVYRVSNYTAAMLDWMHERAGFQAEDAHFVGHSLGAHTAGLTAKYLTAGKVARVTGLDPAGPLFYDKPADRRLDRSDAVFVDVLHANGGSLVQGCIAMNKSLGHVDFYPNGGMHQPGCGTGDPVSDWMDLFADCSHMRAASLWIESIRATTPDHMFKAWPCSDWDSYLQGDCPACEPSGCQYMGYPSTPRHEGAYFLRTSDAPPFALGDAQ
ncbi:pancreatic lipase-related protein 2 [Penaeus vannamei]|uniref:pancreatic lipase-related protein 2 n=1 Tax=Penaeus vannamei TaxID=6689 RepID=UPI00387F4E55